MCMLRLKPNKLTTCHRRKTRKIKKSNYIYNPGVQHFPDSTQHLSILFNFLLGIVLEWFTKDKYDKAIKMCYASESLLNRINLYSLFWCMDNFEKCCKRFGFIDIPI